MQAEMEKHMAYLQKLKDFDVSLAFEKQEKARLEQERRRIEVTHWITSERDTIAPAHTYRLYDYIFISISLPKFVFLRLNQNILRVNICRAWSYSEAAQW